MSKTIRDLIEDLKRLDEVTLLEVLNLRSEDIVSRFEDVIEERFDVLQNEFDEDDAEDEENPLFD